MHRKYWPKLNYVISYHCIPNSHEKIYLAIIISPNLIVKFSQGEIYFSIAHQLPTTYGVITGHFYQSQFARKVYHDSEIMSSWNCSNIGQNHRADNLNVHSIGEK